MVEKPTWTIDARGPESHCCEAPIHIGSRRFELDGLFSSPDGEAALIRSWDADGEMGAGWDYEIGAVCGECDELLAWNLDGLARYLKTRERQGEKPPPHPAQKVRTSSPLEDIGR